MSTVRNQYCEILSCRNTSQNYDGPFFTFPKDPVRLAKWLERLGPLKSNRKYKFVCRNHFSLEAFTDTFKKRLHVVAVPEYQIKQEDISETEEQNCSPMKSSTIKQEDISETELNCFPMKSSAIKQEDISETEEQNCFPTKSSTICSAHSVEDMFDQTLLEGDTSKQILQSKNVNFNTSPVYPKEINKSQETIIERDINCDSNISNNFEDQKTATVVIRNEKDDCQLSLKARNSDNTSDSEEEINENLSKDAFQLHKSHDGIAFVKRKLEQVTGHYEMAQKKRKMYEQKCKLYKKQISALKEVLNSLQLISSIPDVV